MPSGTASWSGRGSPVLDSKVAWFPHPWEIDEPEAEDGGCDPRFLLSKPCIHCGKSVEGHPEFLLVEAP